VASGVRSVKRPFEVMLACGVFTLRIFHSCRISGEGDGDEAAISDRGVGMPIPVHTHPALTPAAMVPEGMVEARIFARSIRSGGSGLGQ
jgi:hypothetical protein